MFFSKKKEEIKTPHNYQKIASKSAYGRAVTSIESAKKELFREHIDFNSLDFLNTQEQFFGLNHDTKKPFYVPFADSTHILYVGATRSAKGVALAS